MIIISHVHRSIPTIKSCMQLISEPYLQTAQLNFTIALYPVIAATKLYGLVLNFDVHYTVYNCFLQAIS